MKTSIAQYKRYECTLKSYIYRLHRLETHAESFLDQDVFAALTWGSASSFDIYEVKF